MSNHFTCLDDRLLLFCLNNNSCCCFLRTSEFSEKSHFCFMVLDHFHTFLNSVHLTIPLTKETTVYNTAELMFKSREMIYVYMLSTAVELASIRLLKTNSIWQCTQCRHVFKLWKKCMRKLFISRTDNMNVMRRCLDVMLSPMTWSPGQPLTGRSRRFSLTGWS